MVESPLAHYGQGGAEVGSAAVGVCPCLEQGPGHGPVLVHHGHEQGGLGLDVQAVHGGSSLQEGFDTGEVASWKHVVGFSGQLAWGQLEYRITMMKTRVLLLVHERENYALSVNLVVAQKVSDVKHRAKH